jgi:hypothetical protein
MLEQGHFQPDMMSAKSHIDDMCHAHNHSKVERRSFEVLRGLGREKRWMGA